MITRMGQMFKKKEGYVAKANRQMIMGKTPEAYRTLIDGLNDYQKRIVKAVCPYNTVDIALLVTTLRNLAEQIYASNPQCHGLVADIATMFTAPAIKFDEKVEPVKRR